MFNLVRTLLLDDLVALLNYILRWSCFMASLTYRPYLIPTHITVHQFHSVRCQEHPFRTFLGLLT